MSGLDKESAALLSFVLKIKRKNKLSSFLSCTDSPAHQPFR